MIVIISVIALGLGYFLSKSSPGSSQNANQAAATTGSSQNTNQAASMNGHHGGAAIAVNSDALNFLMGKPMPDIELKDKDGKKYTTADFKGKNTVLFFNEGLMCYPACWNQIAAFGSDQRFNSDQIQAISIVVDSANDWQSAIAKMPQLAQATTMFDANATVSRQLGLLATASSMHRGSLPGHTYVVIDKDAIVRYVFDDPNMAMANDMLFGKIGELK